MKSVLVLKQRVTLEEFRKFSTIQGKNNFQSPLSYMNHSLDLQGQRKRILF